MNRSVHKHFPQLTRTVYTATIFLSALLLFSVQPMLTKMVLPSLGGSPSVWAVSMCFFQGALLLGYYYAFVLNRLVSGSRSVLLHAVVLVTACLALPVGLPKSELSVFSNATYLWLVAVLVVAVGLPFLAVAANAPLLQSWFARSGDRDAHDPYFLYRASNAGSLAALLAYPVVFEPTLPLSAQATTWSVGFVLLALMIALCGYLVFAGSPEQTADNRSGGKPERPPSAAPVDWRQRLAWMGLAFVPSGLLVAFTTFLTTDVASAPFLWVLPLAIYLVTFIVVFRPLVAVSERWLEAAQPVMVAVAIVCQSEFGRLGLALDSAIGLVAFVTTCLVCHRQLYLGRPAAVHLTEFYLWMSLGGVLGGIFSAIVAPQIFSTTIEYPLLLALGLAWRLRAVKGSMSRLERASIALTVAVAAMLGVAMAYSWVGDPSSWDLSIRRSIVAVLGIVMLATMLLPKVQCTLVTLAALLVTAPFNRNIDYSGRSFFGVHRVLESGAFRLLLHGTTIHGAQRIRTLAGIPVDATSPPPAVTYFHSDSTHVLGLTLMRAAFQDKQRPPTVGIIGLGAGAMACHVRADERWRFFEIDPLVIEIAQNPRLFNYLSSCMNNPDIVVGDARVTLAQEKSGTFDYLLFDAFTSDAVPVHLLTVEALELYLEKLSDRGILALHITNRHLDLVSVVAANIATVPGLSALYINNEGGRGLDALSTQVVLVARHPDILAPVDNRIDALPVVPVGVRPWTDDFSNVASALARGSLRSREDLEIEYLSAVISSRPDAGLGYRRRARAYFRKRDFGAAIDDYTMTMRLFNDDIEAYKSRGIAHHLNGNDLAAIADLTVYLSTKHNDVMALETRGIAYGNIRRRAEAIADFRRVLFLNPSNERSQQLLERLASTP